jgi:hypothetical protein
VTSPAPTTPTLPAPAPQALCCVIIMEATASPLVAQVTPAYLARVAAACAKQLASDVQPIWGGPMASQGGFGVRVGSGPTDVQVGEMVFSIVDSLPDAPGAVAYHDVAGNDVPVAFLALSTCNTLADVSTAISHELCETAGDQACNLWCDDGAGHEWARELCDAVESASYTVDLGDGQPPMPVSDFVLPSFFAPGAPGPFSKVGTATGAFKTASGGYQIQRASGTGETDVTATEGSKRGALVAAGKHHWSSRPARRGVKRAA